MPVFQNIHTLPEQTAQIEKVLAQSIHGHELIKQVQEKIQYIDISRGSNPGDLVVMDCFAPLPGRLSLLASPDLTEEEIVSFFWDIQDMLHKLSPAHFKKGGPVFNTENSTVTGMLYQLEVKSAHSAPDYLPH